MYSRVHSHTLDGCLGFVLVELLGIKGCYETTVSMVFELDFHAFCFFFDLFAVVKINVYICNGNNVMWQKLSHAECSSGDIIILQSFFDNILLTQNISL